MVGITLSAQQINAAPAEVRRWIEEQLLAVLDISATPGQPPAGAAALESCTTEEAARLLELLGGDILTSQLLFELGRDAGPPAGDGSELWLIRAGDLARHTRLTEPAHLAECAARLNQAFQILRDDPEARLVALDAAGNCHIRAGTARHVAVLWQHVVDRHMAADAPRPGSAPPPAASFAPPYRADAIR